MGSASDAQIYDASELKGCVEDGSLGFPDPEPLPNDNLDVPYFFCIWLLPFAGCALSARCMRASCALHARAIRSARQQHAAHSLTFLTCALCMCYACALHTSSALATRCACVVNLLASSKFWQQFNAQRCTGHIFQLSMRGPCVALVWLGLKVSHLCWAYNDQKHNSSQGTLYRANDLRSSHNRDTF